MTHEVFIAHSSQDKPVADAVCAALENIGIRCWIAPRDVRPGLSFAGEITRAIEHSKVMVLIFSAHSNTSAQILREVQLAANSHVHIVQFRMEDVVPNDDLEYYLSTPHWLDALTPPLEANLQRLGTSVKALLEMAPEEPAEGGMMPVAPLVDSRAERSRQDNVATAKDLTTPISAIAALKEPQVWTRKRLIIVSVIVFLLLALAGVLAWSNLKRTDASAQFDLGRRYQNGEGGPKDLGKARDLYQKAADQGYAPAQYNLGWLYEHGEGVPKDLGKAADLYQQAAYQGDPRGQFNLGRLYETGEGVPKDLGKARDLYQAAAAQEWEPAITQLKALSRKSSPTPEPIVPPPNTPPALTLVASIWKAELYQKPTMLATKEFSSGRGPGVSPTSLKEFAEWVSNQLELTARQGAPVRIGVEKFTGPDKLTRRVCNELKANRLIQIVEPVILETVRKDGIDYIISGKVKPKTP